MPTLKINLFHQKARQLILLTLGIFLMVSGLLEFLARAEGIREHLKAPGLGTPHRPFELIMTQLDKVVAEEGNPDCIFLGSSMVRMGINPEVFTAAYATTTGENLRCYNVTIGGLLTRDQVAIAEVLVRKYHPRMLILGIAARDYGPVSMLEPGSLAGTAWVRYWQGDFNLRGFLTEYSMAYRSYLPYQYWRFYNYDELESLQKESEQQVAGISRYGFWTRPAGINLITPDWVHRMIEQQPWYFYNPSPVLRPDSVAAWQDFVRLPEKYDTRFLVVEMPAHPMGYLERRYSQIDFLNFAADMACQNHIPFWATYSRFSLDDEFWLDYIHLKADGATLFSQWLAAQIGRAAHENFDFDSPNRTFCSGVAALQVPENQGLSDENYQAFLSHDTDWLTDGRVFMPANDKILYTRSEQMLQGLFASTLNDNPEQQEFYFDLMKLLDRMLFESQLNLSEEESALLTSWRTTKLPGYLQDLNIEYLLVDERWFVWLTEEELAIINNPEYYEQSHVWTENPFSDDYYLYRVIGTEKGNS